MKVAVVFGSLSDKNVMQKATQILKEFEVPYQAFAISAHRLPKILVEKIEEWEKEGVEVIIAGAGLAAHLPGVLAAHTYLPVIGVPINGALDGLDALLSIVQMPKDIPVATVGIDNAGNAAFLAIQILGIKYPEYQQKLKKYKTDKQKELLENILQPI